jgi:UDP-3-O-[3-hydroxymyristoyl] glucosamine N-acyltransferase
MTGSSERITKVFVVVTGAAPPLVGSSTSAALERFCGQRLLDRALSTAAGAIDPCTLRVAAASLPEHLDATLLPASAHDLAAVLRALADMEPEGEVGLAIDPLHPFLSPRALQGLVASARGGVPAAAGHAGAPAALALPLRSAGDFKGGARFIEVPEREVQRIDDKRALIDLEREAYLARAHELVAGGLLLRDPASTRIEGSVSFGLGVEIEPGCTLRGPIVLGDRVRVGPGCILERAKIGSDSEIRAFSIVEGAAIAERCFVGPYARVRPGTSVGARGQIGNFVELKAALLGTDNRINHLSFVGDAALGDRVTLGAGTITCNHDGTGSQKTVIGDGAYVGSASVLVAPLTVGEDATIGAGSTITRDTPARKLTLARTRQFVVENWARRGSKQG